MISLPGFDAWLNRLVEELAEQADQSVDTYVAHAVATRLIVDVTRRQEDITDLLAHLSSANITVADQAVGPESVVADPERLEALYATGLLDSPRERAYDRITDMAAEALAAPVPAISLIDRDRQFFVSMHGTATDDPDERQTSIDRSVCQYAVASGQPLVIADARVDPVLKDNPAVTDGTVVSYLGIPLIDSDDHALGTLCVWDTNPRDWTSGHVTTLRDLAELARNRMFNNGH